MSSLPVLVVTMAKTCPACQTFKRRTWPSLKKEIEKSNRVELVEIEVSSTNSPPDPNKYHKDLRKYIAWYPTLSLFTGDSWYSNNPLKGVIKDGKLENGRTVEDGDIDLAKKSIQIWLDENLKSSLFSSHSTNSKESVDVGPLGRKLNNNTYSVPTVGSYIHFMNGKLNEDEIY